MQVLRSSEESVEKSRRVWITSECAATSSSKTAPIHFIALYDESQYFLFIFYFPHNMHQDKYFNNDVNVARRCENGTYTDVKM